MRLARLAAAVVLVTALLPGVAEAAPKPIPYLTDDQGRTLILHGFNTAGSAKGDSGLPWITRADVAREAHDLGSNAVRYLIEWKNVEPEPGVYDDKYLDAVATRVGWYREQGINVILDMHQDLYGPTACGQGAGNGAPAWATYTDGQFCTTDVPVWSAIYLEPAVVRAFDNFWNTTGRHPELMARYTAMFQHVARRFAKTPGVLGYDLMNEPWGGSRQGAPFERSILTPFYQRVTNAIRKVDARHWVFVEGQANGVNWGEPSTLGKINGGRIGYVPHLYPPSLDLADYTGLNKALINLQMRHWKDNTLATARRLGAPILLGEFNISDYGQVAHGMDYVDDVVSLMDSLHTGYLFWSNDPGTTVDAKGAWLPVTGHLAVPYARAIAGTPTSITNHGGTLTMSWRGKGTTEVWSAARPSVTLSDGKARWDAARRVLLITTGPGSHHVTVR